MVHVHERERMTENELWEYEIIISTRLDREKLDEALSKLEIYISEGRFTIDDLITAIEREYRLKNVDRTKSRQTGAKRLLEELQMFVDSSIRRDRDGEYIYKVTYSYDGLKGLNKDYKEVMKRYTSRLETNFPTLSRTTIWRVKKELAKYIEKKYPRLDYKDRERIIKVCEMRDYI